LRDPPELSISPKGSGDRISHCSVGLAPEVRLLMPGQPSVEVPFTCATAPAAMRDTAGRDAPKPLPHSRKADTRIGFAA
jgi:hypothetical protein